MISPTYDELHDRVEEDAKLLELMELLRECRAFLEHPFRDDSPQDVLIFRYLDSENLVKRLNERLK